MKALIQRVTSAKVVVDDKIVGEIDKGFVCLLGLEKEDTPETSSKLLNKLLAYRIFSDADGRMNLSLDDINGDILVVSQFTLAADTNKGLRPSFYSAAPPAVAKDLYDDFIAQLEKLAVAKNIKVQTGIFAADMQVNLCNDGPVTFMLQI